MARRGAKPPLSPRSRPFDRTDLEPNRAASTVESDNGDEGSLAIYLGERIRRIALGATAALMTARAFWPSEPEMRKGAGGGLAWVLAVLIVFGLALAGSFLGGRFRFRWSWTDALVVALTFLVAVSATQAIDRRPALNLAWEWASLGFAYILLRNLPRTRNESSVLAGAIVATAFAVSCYGLYQVKVELPIMQENFLRNPGQALQAAGVAPGGRSMELFKSRLLGSNEPWSTFGLPNSLAGFIVGPLVLAFAVGFQNLVRRDGPGSRWTAIGMAAPVILVMLLCLIWTKSRSAYIGLFVAMVVLAFRARRQVPPRLLWAAAAAGLGVVTVVVLASLATGRLDREVLTQSTMSLRFRWEYWQGAWGVISNGATSLKGVLSARAFWSGVGPGNFAAPYLRYKLPEASEEILDPHNLFLEVWASGGIWAFIALVLALACGLWNLLGPPSRVKESAEVGVADRSRRRRARHGQDTTASSPERNARDEEEGAPPRRVGWLIGSAGSGWAVAVMVGDLDPFQGDLFFRWLILGGSWLTAVLLGAPLWSRLPIPAQAMGGAVLAVLINLVAAGGIGIQTVAVALWSLMALGLNLRDDRSCSQLHEVESRVPAFVVAVVWVALLGTFLGAITPFWRSEAAVAAAEEAITRLDYEGADRAYKAAISEDGYNVRPWLGLAYMQSRVWDERGAKADDLRWKAIPELLNDAVSPPRSPNVWSLHSECAHASRRLLSQIGARLDPIEILRLRADIVKATRNATFLYPTNADLHARLAEASAEISLFHDAVNEAKEALRLDRLTPHLDKKLPEAERKRLEAKLPKWSESAAAMPIRTAP